MLKLLALLLWGLPNLVWLSWVFKGVGQELRALRAPPSSEAAVSPQQVPDKVQQVSDEPPRGKKQKKRSSR